MPDLNDFYAFKSTTSSGGRGIGCSVPWLAVVGIVLFLALIGKCSS